MLTSPTVEKLRALRLHAMVTAWEAQQQDPSITALAFDERLALLVDAEWLARERFPWQSQMRRRIFVCPRANNPGACSRRARASSCPLGR